MADLVPLTLDDGTTIYLRSQEENVTVPVAETPVEGGRTSKGPTRSGGTSGTVRGVVPEQSVASLKATIQGYTRHIMSAVEGGPVTPLGKGQVDKVTLEFGVTVEGKAGIPYITEASAAGSLKVTVECKWPS